MADAPSVASTASWRTAVLAVLTILFFDAIAASGQNPAPGKTTPIVAKLLVTGGEGIVELQHPAGSDSWVRILAPADLHVGSVLRVGTNSTALIQFSEKETVQLSSRSRLTLTPPPESPRGFEAWVGKFYLFHRDKPEDFRIRKGRNWMLVRGTEVVLDVSEDNGPLRVQVLEGEVTLDNEFGRTNLVTGEAGVFEPGRAPSKTAMLPASSVIQWFLYYPGVLDPEELPLDEATRTALRASLDAYRLGGLPAALAAYPAGRIPASGAERIYRAALVLSAGQVAEAEMLLSENGRPEENEPRLTELRKALRTLIFAVRSQPTIASPVVEPDPAALASTLIAQSYVEQARFRLSSALTLARAAAASSSNFAFAWARVAELEFGFGRVAAARRAVEKSLALAPHNAQAITLQGYLLAAEGKIEEARAQFERAIALDGALGNAWLGRGLCRIRRGDLAGGRNDLQVAVTLEPNRAVLRSYLGKALDAAGDTGRAFRELHLARRWDPNDPTAYLYSALLYQRENRVNDAIRELERAQELGDNRGVYRSRLLLDQDRAVRSSSLAQIFQRGGLADVSAREAASAVGYDYLNYSAHLFLAQSYHALRDPTRFNLRYETPWLHELLMARLLAPAAGTPLSAHISQQEYVRLFEQDRLGFSSEASYRSDGQYRALASQFGVQGNTAWSLDLEYQHNNGVRPNNKLDRAETTAFVKHQLSPQDSVLLLATYEDFQSGDNFQYADPGTQLRRDFEFSEVQGPVVLGGWHHEWSPGARTLFLAGRLHDRQQFRDRSVPQIILLEDADGRLIGRDSTGVDVDYRNHLELYSAELTQVFDDEWFTFLAGGRYQEGQIRTRNSLSNPTRVPFLLSDPPARGGTEDRFARLIGYTYLTLKPASLLRLTVGLAYDEETIPRNFRHPPVTSGGTDRSHLGPKAGFLWKPLAAATVRGAFSRSLAGMSLDESYRLEPAQLAGFPQGFRTLIPESTVGVGSVSAPEHDIAGVALDLSLPSRSYVGVQWERLTSEVRRRIGVFTAQDGLTPAEPATLAEHLDFEENSLTASVNQLIGADVVVGASYRLSYARLDDVFPDVSRAVLTTAAPEQRATLHRATSFVLFNLASGLFARSEVQWHGQRNVRTAPAHAGDDLVQVNLHIGFRFPRHRGELSVGLLNATAEDYRLSPLTAYEELPRERVVEVRLRLLF